MTAYNNVEIIINSLTKDLGEAGTSHQNNASKSPPFDKTDSDGEMSATTDTYITHSVSGSDPSTTAEPEVEPSKSFVTRKMEKDIFNKARQYLNPGPVLRFFVYLYAERKLLTFFWVHCIATLVVWGE